MTTYQKAVLDAVKQIFGLAATTEGTQLLTRFQGNEIHIQLKQPSYKLDKGAFYYDPETGWQRSR